MSDVNQSDRDAAAKFMGDAWHLFFPGEYEQAVQPKHARRSW